MHTGGLVIQIDKTCRDSCNAALEFGCFLDIIDCIQDNLLDRDVISAHRSLEDIE